MTLLRRGTADTAKGEGRVTLLRRGTGDTAEERGTGDTAEERDG